MLSRQTRNLLATFVRAPSHFKLPPPQALLPITKSTPSTFSLNPPHSLFTIPRSFFSDSSKDDPNSRDPTDPENKDSPKKSSTKPRSSKKKNVEEESDEQGVQNENKPKPKLLETVPIKPVKLALEPGEEKLKPETYVLFSSKTPVVPYSKQAGFVHIGNLAPDHISRKLAFFIQNDAGEIYTVGLVLESDVNKSLKKNITQTIVQPSPEEDKNRHKATISTKQKNYKVKLTEIEIKDDCIFAKAIPYNDSKLSEAEKQINVQSVLTQMKDLTASIRQSVQHEKITIFTTLKFDGIYKKEIDPVKLDELLCNIVGECQKLSPHFKENFHTFVQAFLVERNPIARMYLVRRKLEEIKSVLEIVNRSIQHADEQIWKFHEQAKARLSLDYIRSAYFSGENAPQTGPGSKAGTGTSQGAQAGPGGTPLSGAAKRFMDMLPSIQDEVSQDKIRKEIERLSLQDKMSGEYHKLYTYLDEVFSIPWKNYSEELWDIEYSKKVLEENLFGLDKVKERIIEMIAVNKLQKAVQEAKNKKKGFVILLNGPPGTGKTTIAKSIAKALKRESRFISFAGVTDPAFVKGHKRTYLDAQPGIFVKELIKSKVMNPVFILDEVDKLSKHFQGVDPYYALMEILNPEENHNFTDHYLDIKVDFSHVIFILTSNHVLNMLEPLRNRLEIIEVPAYIEQEKLTIAKKYLIPSVLGEHALPADNIQFDDETVRRVVKGWCYYESGVRELRRCFEKIARKHALDILSTYEKTKAQTPEVELHSISQEEAISKKPDESPSAEAETTAPETSPSAGAQENVQVNQGIDVEGQNQENKETSTKRSENPESKVKPVATQNTREANQIIELKNQIKLVFDSSTDPNDEILKKYLGNPIFDDMYERRHRKPFLGTANVLTVSGFVGHVMTVECIYDLSNQDKKGVLTSSGNLQKVLQESLTIARLVAFRFLPENKIKEVAEKSLHIHFLQGGVPKDGPSAGVSICSAFLSLMLEKPIPQDISMTGELSLHGDVCKIGGVQAKITASKALDINRIIIPWGNKTEFFELPQMLKDGLTVYFVKNYQEVYNILFENSPEAIRGIEKYVDGQFFEPVAPLRNVTMPPAQA